jgi:hypothetical protein
MIKNIQYVISCELVLECRWDEVWDSEIGLYDVQYENCTEAQDSRFLLDRRFEINTAENWNGI